MLDLLLQYNEGNEKKMNDDLLENKKSFILAYSYNCLYLQTSSLPLIMVVDIYPA